MGIKSPSVGSYASWRSRQPTAKGRRIKPSLVSIQVTCLAWTHRRVSCTPYCSPRDIWDYHAFVIPFEFWYLRTNTNFPKLWQPYAYHLLETTQTNISLDVWPGRASPLVFLTPANPSNAVPQPLPIVVIHSLYAWHIVGAQQTFAFQNGTNLIVEGKGST